MQDSNYKNSATVATMTSEKKLLSSLVVEYSVTEISTAIKHVVENNFNYIRVRGEISGLKIAASGHAYFNVKDNNAILACTCWRQQMSKININIEDGLEVIVTGKITTYAGQSKYQMTVELIDVAGVGALMLQFERLRQLFIQEGLFVAERKQKLPFMPLTIGVITSMSGAVICDIMHRIKARCPVNVIIWPVTVQGLTAATEITEAITGFNNYAILNIPLVEVIIVARGGGSIEDLWSFNEEIVVRATANSIIPIVSAIGHETDTTLTDFAADLRAPTPTAAAELVVPVLSQLRNQLLELNYRLTMAINKLIDNNQYILDTQISRLPKAIELIVGYEQRIDNLSMYLQDALPKLLTLKKLLLNRFPLSLLDPRRNISIKQQKLSNVIQNFQINWQQLLLQKSAKMLKLSYSMKPGQLEIYYNNKNINFIKISELLHKAIQRLMAHHFNKLVNYSNLLNSLNYKQVLRRGFAIVSIDGKIITAAEQLTSKDIDIEFYDSKAKLSAK